MSNPLTHVATRRAGVIVGAPARATELGMERVLQGRYKIEEPLGVGGSSQVYLARDQALNRDVALKVLPEAFTADRDRRARFTREAQVLASLNHPNVAHVHGFENAGTSEAITVVLNWLDELKPRVSSAGPYPQR